MRTMSERTRSRYDHNRPASALASSALNVRVTRERLPFATFQDKQVLTMSGWDAAPTDREAARARLAHARATFRRTYVV